MKAYIQTDKTGNYYNVNAYIANEGFTTLGWKTEKYFSVDKITDNNPENILVGGIGNVRKRLKNLNINRPSNEIDYPEELLSYLGRKIWKSNIEKIIDNPNSWNIFIKPTETKKFAGKIVRELKDFTGLLEAERKTEIWCSEISVFLTEWRCFIRYGSILDVRQYKGAWDSKLDLDIVKNAILDFKNAPNAYALDFGIDENQNIKLVEVNDGHSLGAYGMNPVDYAKFLSARWSQLTNTKDYNYF